MAVSGGRIDRILIVHADPAVGREIEAALRRAHPHPLAARHAASAAAAVQAAREYDPRIVFLDLGQERAVALSAATELRRSDRMLIGLLNPLMNGGGADLLRHAVRAGISDFVSLPLSDDEVVAVLAAAPQQSSATHEARTIAFFGHQGGVGTTTLAINTAFAIRAGDATRTAALLDANVQFGSVASHLGIVPERDLGDTVREIELGAMLPLESAGPDPGVALVASPVDPRVAERITPEDMSRVVIELRRRFHAVVIDTAPVLDLLTLSVLDLSDTVVVVTEASAPTVAGTARLLRMLSTLGFGDERIRLAVSRYRSAPEVLHPDVVAQQLGRAVDYVVPFNTPVALGSHRGVPALFDRNAAPFADVVKRIARAAPRGKS